MASKNTPDSQIDVTKLRISDDPYNDGRAEQKTKYDEFFASVKPNKRIVCPAGKAGGLASSFRKWLTKRGEKSPVVRSRETCQDGHGGVWWIKEAAKPATLWQPMEKKAA